MAPVISKRVKYSAYVCERIFHLKRSGHSLKKVTEILQSEGIGACYESVRRLWVRFLQRRHLNDSQRSGRVDKALVRHPYILDFVEEVSWLESIYLKIELILRQNSEFFLSI